MQIITSKDNEAIKSIRKLKEKKYRDETNEYVIEGIKVIKEAIEENIKIKRIVICEECLKDNCLEQSFLYKIAKYECIYVSSSVFKCLTDVVNPQGILAVIEKNSRRRINRLHRGYNCYIRWDTRPRKLRNYIKNDRSISD